MSLIPLDYQLNPIEYLVAKCGKQHGLILNHLLGTGKTFTGILFFKNYPNHKKIVILPNGIQNIWLREAKVIGVTDIEFITYTELINCDYNNRGNSYTKKLKNAIVIVDECHNLYKIIEKLKKLDIKKTRSDKNDTRSDTYKKSDFNENQNLINFINMFNNTKKILLITGTLITNDIYDIRWLVNIAAGKNILPYNNLQFYNKFVYKTKMDVAIFEWVLPVLRNVITNKIVVPYQELFFKDIRDSNSSYLNILYIFTSNTLINTIKYYYKKNYLKIIPRHLSLKELIMYNLTNYDNILLALFLTILSKGVKVMLNFIKTYYTNEYNFVSLNIVALKENHVDRYFSYYKYTKDNELYPKIKFHNIIVNYTYLQLKLWIKLINLEYNPLTSEELYLLELHPSIRDAELYSKNNIDKNLYQNKGRIIGNLYDTPLKFKGIVDMYLTDKVSTVVYSEFLDSGIKLFIKYLKLKNIKYKFYQPNLSVDKRNQLLEDFKNEKFKLLLLHPDSFEGIDIKGAKQFHILEPIANYYKKEQLYARVSRLNSHTHLPKNQQNVKIYIWTCSIRKDFDKLKHLKEIGKTFLENNKLYYNFFIHQSKLSIFFSPDDQIMAISNKYDMFIKNLNNIISDNNINHTDLPIKCNIYGKNYPNLPKC